MFGVFSAVAPWFPPEPSALIDGHEIREDDLWTLAVERRTGERVRVLEA